MRLSSRTDYALRLMMRLALDPETPVTIETIASEYKLSHNHLMKIAHHLGKLGYIETQRGRAGGLRLGQQPASIRIGAFVRDVEPDMALVECLCTTGNACILTPSCKLRGILLEALKSFVAVLDQYTLADLVAAPSELAKLLKLTKPA